MLTVGVDLGGTSIKTALVERGRGIVHESAALTEAEGGPQHVLDRIAALVREVSASAGLERLEGIGVGAPGSINWDRTTISYPPNILGWEVVNVQAELQRRLELAVPVIVENDANVAGLGSAHFGAGRPFRSFLMVTLGTGVGGAIIYEGHIFRGSTGAAGEIGHMTIDRDGPPANSGVRGAIEAFLGHRFLSNHARTLLAGKTTLLHDMLGPGLDGLTPRHLHEAAQAGDTAAEGVLRWAGERLGAVLGSAINLLDIRKVVVGGGVSAAGSYILGPAREVVASYVTPALRDGIEILQETLGNEAGTLGAAHLLFEHLDRPRAAPTP
jgi:glucokinase